MVGRGGGQKKNVLGGNKERFVQKKGFWFVKMGGFCNQQEKVVFVHKKAAFADSKKLFEQAVFWLRKREVFEGKA